MRTDFLVGTAASEWSGIIAGIIMARLDRADDLFGGPRGSPTFPTQESAIEAAIKAGRQEIDVGFEQGSVVNG